MADGERVAQEKLLPPGLFKEAQEHSTEQTLSSKSRRLVHWNVSLLVKLLEKVAAARNSQQPSTETINKVRRLEKRLVQEASILEEVQESIAVSKTHTTKISVPQLPIPLSSKTNSLNINTATGAPVPDVVQNELKRYVTKIASLHPENPFHNVRVSLYYQPILKPMDSILTHNICILCTPVRARGPCHYGN